MPSWSVNSCVNLRLVSWQSITILSFSSTRHASLFCLRVTNSVIDHHDSAMLVFHLSASPTNIRPKSCTVHSLGNVQETNSFNPKQEKQSESIGLICLCVVLVLIYLAWVLLTLRYHCQVRGVQIPLPVYQVRGVQIPSTGYGCSGFRHHLQVRGLQILMSG